MKHKYHRRYHKERLAPHSLDASLIKRLFSYLLPFKGVLLISLVFLILSKAIEAYIPIYIGTLTQQILTSFQLDTAGKDLELSHVIHATLWMLGLLLMSCSMEMCNVFLKSWIGQKAIYNLRTEVYDHILKLPQAVYDRTPVGRLMTRTIHDVDQIDQMFTESVVPLLGNFFLFICMGVAMVFLDVRIALLAAILLPMVGALLYNFRTHQRRCYELIRSVVAALNTFVQEHLTGVSVIRSFGLEKQEKKRFEELNEDHCNSYLESVEHFGFFISGIDFLSSLSIILVFMLLVFFAAPATGFQVGTYFTFSLYSMMFFRPLIDLAERYNVLQSALAASERVFEILDQPEENPGPSNGPNLTQIDSIAFENVWFAYQKEEWVLKGLSFQLAHGESLAIVGITGAGKSSVMNLLLRLYEFQKGTIKVNGVDIRSYAVKDLRAHFSAIFQDPVLFSDTLEENIRLYDPSISKSKVEEAVEFVHLKPVVDRSPAGLQQKLTERGKSLSMGERQLVSLARAVAHDRSVLIFDEATANIDTATEKVIQTALAKILKSKMALVIAHRLSTIQDVHRILVLHQGVAIETGTHQQLLQKQGLYEKLYRLQFANE